MKTRPNFEEIEDAEDFDNWYWMKEELVAICKASNIHFNGRKNELRQRIIDQMNGKKITKSKTQKPTSNFNWAKEKLTLKTVITDSVTFGKNLRHFMKSQISGFVSSAEFMDWVKQNPGKTLQDAVDIYFKIETDKKKGIKIDKSDFNVMNAYIDSFLKANPNLSRKEALKCWDIKKYMPAKKGLVKYEDADLKLIQVLGSG